ncbi:hypothetical protein, partial [Halorubrum sp. Ea1]|uniref:hypothetical protein n=1 Tax=Halorubrum sp. Ea1 TaxID=1480718 RepID=UPI001C3D2AA1
MTGFAASTARLYVVDSRSAVKTAKSTADRLYAVDARSPMKTAFALAAARRFAPLAAGGDAAGGCPFESHPTAPPGSLTPLSYTHLRAHETP